VADMPPNTSRQAQGLDRIGWGGVSSRRSSPAGCGSAEHGDADYRRNISTTGEDIGDRVERLAWGCPANAGAGSASARIAAGSQRGKLAIFAMRICVARATV
jgi:hypothetical protein